MTDEELNEMTLLKLQYGPSNVRTGWVEIHTLDGLRIGMEEVYWYRKGVGLWNCDEMKVELGASYDGLLIATWLVGEDAVINRMTVRERYQRTGEVWLPAIGAQILLTNC